MKAPSFSLKSLLLLVVAIALFLPHYPFLQRPFMTDLSHGTDIDPVYSVKAAVWQTAAAEVIAIAGWFLLKRMRARRLKHAVPPP